MPSDIPRDRRPDRLAPVAMLFTGAVGLTLAAFGGCYTVMLARAARWPHTAGVVDSSAVVDVSDAGSSFATARQAEVSYTYEVGGRRFTSGRLRIVGDGLGARLHLYAPAMADRYPVGATVVVAYDPADPARAVLLPLVGSGRAYAEAVGGLGMVVAYAVFLFQPRRGVFWQPRPEVAGLTAGGVPAHPASVAS